MQYLPLLEALLAPIAPSGCEEGMVSRLTAALTHPANTLHRDALGNLIVHRPGCGVNKKALLFTAHMDSIGLMVTEITEQGFLRFVPLGGFVACDLARSVVVFPQKGAEPLRGIVVPDEKKESKLFTLEELSIDIGATSREEAQTLVQVGDCCTYAPTCFTQGNRLFATYLDNRSGCAALLAALQALGERTPYNDLYLAFTAQEEVGVRGARTVAYPLPVDYAIAVDVTCTCDQPGSDHTATALLGKGAALKLRDGRTLCNRPLTQAVERLATANAIPWQTDILQAGSTDAGALQFTRDGLPVTGISIPCRYTHTPVECIDLRDFDAVVALLTTLTESEIAL